MKTLRRLGAPATRLTVLGLTFALAPALAAQHGARPSARSHESAPARPAPHAAAAAVRWNELAQPLIGGHGGAGMATRPLAILSVAQLAASRTPSAVREAAIATASAEVLAALFPDHAARFHAALDGDVARRALGVRARASADSLGRATASATLAHARADRSDIPWRGTVPATPGSWTNAKGEAPVGAEWVTIRPWVLGSPSQFRPAAPPAVGTTGFASELDAVRRTVASRTEAQLASARHWADVPLARYWNEVATRLVAKHGVTTERAPAVLAALNVALSDANVACFDAKYAYWSIRPSQADTTIRPPVMLPNFPAYPSGHACLSAAAAAALGAYFPAERTTLARTVAEVADSRVYAGVHYPLDNTVGIEIGRKVADTVVGALRAGWSAPATMGENR